MDTNKNSKDKKVDAKKEKMATKKNRLILVPTADKTVASKRSK